MNNTFIFFKILRFGIEPIHDVFLKKSFETEAVFTEKKINE